MSQLYLDQDGVLADFDGYYLRTFGTPLERSPDGDDPPNMWENIRRHGMFYRHMTLMPDAMALWEGVRHLSPIVLTGVPFDRVPGAEAQKCAWLREHLGASVPVICCEARDKYLHAAPGDILIDDWAKYRDLWEAIGGRFILHTGAVSSLRELEALCPTR